MRLTVDRFEGEFVICEKEDGTMVDINRDLLPDEVKEGDVLLIDGDVITVDKESTLERKERIKKLMDDLWE
ncbi:MAG: DUF3006 domain-containing protein [Tissierellales bacterium]